MKIVNPKPKLWGMEIVNLNFRSEGFLSPAVHGWVYGK